VIAASKDAPQNDPPPGQETCADPALSRPAGATLERRDKAELPTEVALLGAGLFGNLAMSVLSPALPVIQAHFADVPNVAYLTKFLVSVVGLATIAVSLFAGPLIDGFGRRRVLLAAYALFVVAGTIGMWLPTLPMIIVSRVIAGAAGALIVTTGITLIADIYQGRPRERRIGVNHAIGALMLGVLVPFAGYLADFNWRWAFLIHLIGLPMLVCVYFSGDLGRLDQRMRTKTNSGSRYPESTFALCLLTLVAGAIGYSVQIYVPFHLRLIGSVSAATAGAMFSITVLFSVATSFMYAEVRRLIAPAGIFCAVFLGWSAGLSTIAFTTSVLGVGAGMAITGLAGGLLGPNLFATVASATTDANRPRTVGLIKGIYYAGPFVGPTALHVVDQRHGPDGALVTLAAAAGVMCIVMCGVWRRLAAVHRVAMGQ
jgi:MFS family permease